MIQTSIKISRDEYQRRTQALLAHIEAENLTGVVLFDQYYILYYTGFAFAPTERPMAFLMNRKGEKVLFVPRLELEHAQANAVVDRVDHYTEYPFQPHPMEGFKKSMESLGFNQDFGAVYDGYPWAWGYR